MPFFGELTYDLTDTLSATGGVRYFHNDATSVDQQTHPFGGFGASPPFTPQTNVAVDSKVTYKANLSWKPHKAVLIYGTVASASAPAAPTRPICPSPQASRGPMHLIR